MRIYDAKDYKEFINAELGSPRFPKGVRTRLAEFLGVQPSLISLVLSGKQDFGPEHGVRIAQFLELDRDETHFLILLMSHARAGSELLKKHYSEEISEFKNKKNTIKSRVKGSLKTLSPSDLQEYYGAWFHTAVHMGVRIPEFGEPSQLAEALKIDLSHVKRSLAFLERAGFVKQERGKWVVTDQRFHFADKTPMLRAHHTNWRAAAIRSLDEPSPDDLHYSSVMSIDQRSFDQIKRMVLEAIEKMDPIIKDAKDKQICTLGIDLFKVTN